MSQVSTKLDPAPSRWAYRFQRLMLTPLFRKTLKVGLPFCLSLGLGLGWMADEGRRDSFNMALIDLRNQIETRPEFMVNLLAVDGASVTVSEDIREIIPLDFPISSFDLDLPAMQEAVAGLPAVERASVRIRNGGVLQVEVVERQPAALWRTREGLELLDMAGISIGQVAQRNVRADLPLIAGEGAERQVPQALALMRAAGPLGDRLRGLVRIGERRWDVVLDRGQRINLPVENPVQALERIIALNQAQELLARDLTVVDMRLAARPTIRMSAPAVEEWWRINAIGAGEQKR